MAAHPMGYHLGMETTTVFTVELWQPLLTLNKSSTTTKTALDKMENCCIKETLNQHKIIEILAL